MDSRTARSLAHVISAWAALAGAGVALPLSASAEPAARPPAPSVVKTVTPPPAPAAVKPAEITTGTLPAEPPAQPATATATTAAGRPAGQLAEVLGFRSAKFGMSEDEVRAAIIKDFRVLPQAIKQDENKLEKTRMLSIDAPDALPGGGTATVTYVFGYESKKLIQAGVVWSKSTDGKMTPEQIYSNANVLRSHFIAAGYKPATISMNMPVAGGLLMFRGSDSEGRTTLMVLQGEIAAANEAKQRVLTPTALTLFYVADAKKPDVYRLPAGLF